MSWLGRVWEMSEVSSLEGSPKSRTGAEFLKIAVLLVKAFNQLQTSKKKLKFKT